MSLRAFGTLINRGFSPRVIRQAQARALGLASSGARPMHTLRDGALTVVGFIAALLYCEEDESAVAPATHRKGNMYKDPAIRAKFTDKDGKVAWLQYKDYINIRKKYPKLTEEEVLGMMRQSTAKEAVVITLDLEDAKVDESVMRARFEEWIKEYGRSYKSEEEKASRYQVFKVNAIKIEKMNALPQSGGALYGPTIYMDWTEEEFSSQFHGLDDAGWEGLFDTLGLMYDNGGIEVHPMEREGGEQLCTESVRQWYMKQKEKAAEQDAAASGGTAMGNPKAILLMIYDRARRWLQPRTPPPGQSSKAKKEG